MKPAQFQYHRPSSVEEAVELAESLEEAEYMAGNQSLGIVMANRLATPVHLIDLNGPDELDHIDVGEDAVRIGSMTTHRAIEKSSDLREHMRMLPESAEQIAGPSVRNMGTLGGSIGEADPAGNYPAALVALDGEITLRSTEESRTVAARDYFIAYMFTDREEHELIESVTVDRAPFPTDRTGMAFAELKRAAQTFPTISAAASVRVEDPGAEEPVIEDARLALANAADIPLHVPDAEAALEGKPLSEGSLEEAGQAAHDAAEPSDEMHVDEPFKRDVAGEYTKRALRTAYGRATGGGS